MIVNDPVEIHGALQALHPSLLQWSAFVRSYFGLLAVTPFGRDTQHFMQFNRNAEHWVGSSQEITEALNAFGRVSRGYLSTLTLGPFIGHWQAEIWSIISTTFSEL